MERRVFNSRLALYTDQKDKRTQSRSMVQRIHSKRNQKERLGSAKTYGFSKQFTTTTAVQDLTILSQVYVFILRFSII